MSDIFSKFAPMKKAYNDLKNAAGMNPLGVRIENFTSRTEASVNGYPCILMGSNNYLGLTFDPDAIEASKKVLDQYGTGTTGSRVANGSYAQHQNLEKQIAEFYNKKNAILFTTGYQANVGFLSAICGKDDFLVIDAESHASIYDGCRLSYATTIVYRHNDPVDLEKRLSRLPKGAVALVVTEGIFSMRGDRAPLKEIVAAAKKHNAYVMVDEAHSLGVLGREGRGLAEEEGVEDQIDFILGTFSKSVGTIGGYCVSDHADLDIVRFAARAYLFTASLPPSIIASAGKTLQRIKTDFALREQLWKNTAIVYDGLRDLGYDIGAVKSPVIGIMMPDQATGIAIWRGLIASGVYVNLVLPPAAPAGRCLLRCSISAAHTEDQLMKVLEVFAGMREQTAAMAAE